MQASHNNASGPGIIQTENLTKMYSGGVRALDNLTLSVEQGEIFGYLGPNGAGKTTTIRLLLDLIRPTSGSASIWGLDVNRNSLEVRRRIGYLPGELSLWDGQTATQVVRYLRNLRGGVDMTYVHSLAERLQFDMTKKIRSYSQGNKRKLGLILAMMSKPDLLILDEPTSGLDPLMQQTFYQMMREVRSEGRTVFLSSHILGEVQAICDRVGILRGGQLRSVQRVADLMQADFRWVTLTFREPAEVAWLAAVPEVGSVTVDGRVVRLQLTGDFDPLLRAIGDHYVENIKVQEPSLEEIFLSFYGDGETESQREPATPMQMEAR
ncbi:MAG: ABC transporter ATP-binding protein [Chloroflexi bacterium]|nr:ABC transporter ATP-binding protein [Chloroflexota bacterium]